MIEIDLVQVDSARNEEAAQRQVTLITGHAQYNANRREDSDHSNSSASACMMLNSVNKIIGI